MAKPKADGGDDLRAYQRVPQNPLPAIMSWGISPLALVANLAGSPQRKVQSYWARHCE